MKIDDPRISQILNFPATTERLKLRGKYYTSEPLVYRIEELRDLLFSLQLKDKYAFRDYLLLLNNLEEGYYKETERPKLTKEIKEQNQRQLRLVIYSLLVDSKDEFFTVEDVIDILNSPQITEKQVKKILEELFQADVVIRKTVQVKEKRPNRVKISTRNIKAYRAKAKREQKQE